MTPSPRVLQKTLLEIFRRLAKHYGPTHWWPGDTPFEIAVGAILTQNTAWSNVEKAIENLKSAGLLNPRAILRCPEEQLYNALKPSGYFRVKTQRLRAFCDYLVERHRGDIASMAKRDTAELRKELLHVHGIGEETADDILLYACDKPIFVVDAYTRRILHRHGICSAKIDYGELQRIFHQNLPVDLTMFKEYHGLIVYTGKDFCRKTPRCDQCPLKPLLPKDNPPPRDELS